MHPALRDANLTGDEIRPLMLVGDQRYRVFAPDWHRLGKRLLTMTTTGQNPAPSTLPERRLITNGGERQDVNYSGYGERSAHRCWRSARGTSIRWSVLFAFFSFLYQIQQRFHPSLNVICATSSSDVLVFCQ